VACGIHYDAMHLHDVYKIKNSKCPNSEIESKNTLSIPFHEKLSLKDVKFVIKSMHEYIIN